jgi:hypothetical protein
MIVTKSSKSERHQRQFETRPRWSRRMQSRLSSKIWSYAGVCAIILALVASFSLSPGGFAYQVASESGVIHTSSVSNDPANPQINPNLQNLAPDSQGGGGGGCSTTCTFTVDVFFGYGRVAVGGVGTYTNGQVVTLTKNTQYSISPSGITSGWIFWQWQSNAATIGSITSSSTTLTPTASGSIVLVLQERGPSNWAGYVQSGTNFTYAGGYFTLPSTYTYSPCNGGSPCPTEEVSYWVGIGGLASLDWLYQAGVVVTMTCSSCTPTANMWVEIPGAGLTDTNEPFTPHLGDYFEVYVSMGWGPGPGTGCWTTFFYFHDITQGTMWSSFWSVECGWGSVMHTAEWIAESPAYNGVGPGYIEPVPSSPLVWDSAGMSQDQNGGYQSLIEPIGALYLWYGGICAYPSYINSIGNYFDSEASVSGSC